MTEWSDDEDEAPGATHDDVDEADDGFIVHDEEEDEDAEASDDDMDRLERSIEAQERKRRSEQDESAATHAPSDDEDA